MVQLINPTDLPARHGESKSFETCEVVPPGVSKLRHTPGRGTDWYCQGCLAFVDPIYIRVENTIYPACLECFYNEIPELQDDLESAEVVNVEETLELASTIPAAGSVPDVSVN